MFLLHISSSWMEVPQRFVWWVGELRVNLVIDFGYSLALAKLNNIELLECTECTFFALDLLDFIVSFILASAI
jgi:hypothetical protein